jgi:carboxypeptidase Q
VFQCRPGGQKGLTTFLGLNNFTRISVITMAYKLSRIYIFYAFALVFVFPSQFVHSQSLNLDDFQDISDKIIEKSLANTIGWERLTYFVDYFPGRLSGSEILEESIDWALEMLQNDGFNNIYGQPVTVPHWVRGNEYLKLHLPYERNMPMLGLGNSIGTHNGPIRAEAIVVKSFDELEERALEIEGKIVVYNMPWTNYGETVQYRVIGAIEASRYGAVASLIRSVTPFSMQTPHTGNSSYEEGIKKIPHAALTPEDVKFMQRMQDRGETIELELYMEAQQLPDAESRNVIAEIPGSEYPDQIITIGGHIDSWDVGQGAMDDAGGVFAAWEAARIIKNLGLQPKRTIRLVFWTNEENGLMGAEAYRDKAVDEGIDNHVFAFESDFGVFEPMGINFAGSTDAISVLQEIVKLLQPISTLEIEPGFGAPDLSPLIAEGIPGAGLVTDAAKYFWYHHTHADTIDKLDKKEFNKSVAVMAVITYVIAQMDENLPR